MVPNRLLRRHEVAHPESSSGPCRGYTIWRETPRRQVRVARVLLGTGSEPLPEGLEQMLVQWFPAPGSRVAETAAATRLAAWSRQAGATPMALLDRLIGNGYLLRYERLGPDGLSAASPADLYLGSRGEALLAQRRSALDARVQTFLSELSAEVRALPTRAARPGYLQLRRWLEAAVTQLESGAGVTLPGSTEPLSAAQAQLQGALRFLVAAAARIGSGSPFDWKEIGALYHPGIGASKQFDLHQERLLGWLEAICTVPAEVTGLISLGSLYAVFATGRLQYSACGRERTLDPGAIAAICSDELENLTVIRRPAHLVLTENRSLLLKAAHSGWTHQHNVLLLGLDGQPRSGFLRLLKAIGLPPVIWVDADDAGAVIGRVLTEHEIIGRWVLPPLTLTPASELGDYDTWQVRMGQRLELGPTEQEAHLGDPADWRFLLEG